MDVTSEFIHNGIGHGDVASMLLEAKGDPNAFRPFEQSDGTVAKMVLNSQGVYKPQRMHISNATTLRADQWKQIDDAIKELNFPDLTVTADLRNLSSYTLPNGLGTTVLEYSKGGDIRDAQQGMDPIGDADFDRPQEDVANLPIPVTWKDWFFTWREMEVIKTKPGARVDTRQAVLAKRKIDEYNEKVILGVTPGVTYAGGTVYGYRNHPDTITYSGLTLPTDPSWTPDLFIAEVLDMQQELIDENLTGPVMIYMSTGWRKFLLSDQSAAKGVGYTLLDRFRAVDGIAGVKAVSYLPNYEVLVIRWSPETARMVSGLGTRVVQWPTHGGFGLRFKILNSQTPQIFTDYNGITGIVHAVAS